MQTPWRSQGGRAGEPSEEACETQALGPREGGRPWREQRVEAVVRALLSSEPCRFGAGGPGGK